MIAQHSKVRTERLTSSGKDEIRNFKIAIRY